MKTNKKGFENIKNVGEKITRYVGLVVLVLMIISLFGSISRMKDVALKIDKEKEQVDKLKKENEELQKNLEISRSEEFVEKQLRDKLGLAKDGEIVVILPDTEAIKKFAPRMDDEEEILPDPNWKKWVKLFL